MVSNPFPAITQALELSTTHVSMNTAYWLSAEAQNFVFFPVYNKADHGWFIPLDEDIFSKEKANNNIPSDL